MVHFIISENIRKEIRNIVSFTELKKLHWLLSNGHFSVISERALVYIYDYIANYLNIQRDSEREKERDRDRERWRERDRERETNVQFFTIL